MKNTLINAHVPPDQSWDNARQAERSMDAIVKMNAEFDALFAFDPPIPDVYLTKAGRIGGFPKNDRASQFYEGVLRCAGHFNHGWSTLLEEHAKKGMSLVELRKINQNCFPTMTNDWFQKAIGRLIAAGDVYLEDGFLRAHKESPYRSHERRCDHCGGDLDLNRQAAWHVERAALKAKHDKLRAEKNLRAAQQVVADLEAA